MCPNIINFDSVSVDFSERRPEEVKFVLMLIIHAVYNFIAFSATLLSIFFIPAIFINFHPFLYDGFYGSS